MYCLSHGELAWLHELAWLFQNHIQGCMYDLNMLLSCFREKMPVSPPLLGKILQHWRVSVLCALISNWASPISSPPSPLRFPFHARSPNRAANNLLKKYRVAHQVVHELNSPYTKSQLSIWVNRSYCITWWTTLYTGCFPEISFPFIKVDVSCECRWRCAILSLLRISGAFYLMLQCLSDIVTITR